MPQARSCPACQFLQRLYPCLLLATLLLAGVNILSAKVVTNEPKPEPPKAPLIVKYLGSEQTRYNGHPYLVVGGQDMLTNQQIRFIVPNNDTKSYKYDPKTSVVEALDQLKPGDLAKVDAKTDQGMTWLDGIEKYKNKPGEEVAGNFVFYETYEDKDNEPHKQVVNLQKFGQTVDVMLPMKANDKKEMEIDSTLLAEVNKFSKGDVVAAEVTSSNPPVLRSIELYKAPQEAKLGKVVEAEVATDQKGPAVELDQDGKTVTLPIRGKLQGKKWVADPMILAHAKAMKPGMTVLFSTHEEDGKTYLKDLKPAPAPDAKPKK